MDDETDTPCLLCGEVNAPVWSARLHLGIPGIAFLLIGKMDILSLELFKELCQQMWEAGIKTLENEGFELKAVQVATPHLKLVKPVSLV